VKISDPENGRFLQTAPVCQQKSGRCLVSFSLLTQLIAAEARHSFDQRPVVGHPHVEARIQIGAADAVRNGSDQRPTAVVEFHYQMTATTVALCAPPYKTIKFSWSVTLLMDDTKIT
jgi:hypothetical protein